jgi:hypothetical protein
MRTTLAEPAVLSARALAPGLTLAHATFALAGRGDGAARRCAATLAVADAADGWEIVHLHVAPADEGGAPSPAHRARRRLGVALGSLAVVAGALALARRVDYRTFTRTGVALLCAAELVRAARDLIDYHYGS